MCGLGVRPQHLCRVTGRPVRCPGHAAGPAARAPACALPSWPSAARGRVQLPPLPLWGCSCWARHVLSTEAPSRSGSSRDPAPCRLTGSLSVPTAGCPSCFPPGQVGAAALAQTPLSAGGSHPIPAPQPEAPCSLLAPLRPSQAPRGLLTRPVSSSFLPSCRAWPWAETRNVPTLSKEGVTLLLSGPSGTWDQEGDGLGTPSQGRGIRGAQLGSEQRPSRVGVPSAPPPWVRRCGTCAPSSSGSDVLPPLHHPRGQLRLRNSRHGCLRPLPIAGHFDLLFPPFTVPVTGPRVSKFCEPGGQVVG